VIGHPALPRRVDEMHYGRSGFQEALLSPPAAQPQEAPQNGFATSFATNGSSKGIN
jgi:hypothetical protein